MDEKKKGAVRFSQWRPIGVCDDGPENQVQARIFTEKDLHQVTQPQINRDTWRQSPEVLKIIHRYAKDIAKRSVRAKDMKKPAVAEIKLVGTVMKFNKTPGLNQESEEGRVQLFQVSFVDVGQDRNLLIRRGAFIGLGFCALIVLLLTFLPPLEFELEKAPPPCSANRTDSRYALQLRYANQNLREFITSQPAQSPWLEVKDQCFSLPGSVPSRERYLLDCFSRTLTSLGQQNIGIPQEFEAQLDYIAACVDSVCDKGLSHLQASCQML